MATSGSAVRLVPGGLPSGGVGDCAASGIGGRQRQAVHRSRPRRVLPATGGGPDHHGRPGSPGPARAAPPVLLGRQIIGVALDEQLDKHRVHDVPPGPSAASPRSWAAFAGLVACYPGPRSSRAACIWLFVSAGDVYPLTFTSRLTTGQFTMNPLEPNGLPAGNPVALPSATCCKAAGKSVWRRLSPAVTAAAVQVARWMSHIGL